VVTRGRDDLVLLATHQLEKVGSKKSPSDTKRKLRNHLFVSRSVKKIWKIRGGGGVLSLNVTYPGPYGTFTFSKTFLAAGVDVKYICKDESLTSTSDMP
jgi:hypothetical protein